MIYLLGGAPRTGKTGIARTVAEREGIGWLSTDTIQWILRDHLPPEWHEVAAPLKPPGPAQDILYPYFRDAVVGSAYLAPRYLIEGAAFLPRQAVEVGLEVDTRACFVGMSRVTLESINEHARVGAWHLDQPAAVRERFPDWIVSWSRTLEDECERLSVPYFDLGDDYGRQVERVIDALLG